MGGVGGPGVGRPTPRAGAESALASRRGADVQGARARARRLAGGGGRTGPPGPDPGPGPVGSVRRREGAAMTERERQQDIDRRTARLLAALEAGDHDVVDQIWAEAGTDEEVVVRFVEACAAFTGDADAAAERRAGEVVADALRRAAPTLELVDEQPGPVTVAE